MLTAEQKEEVRKKVVIDNPMLSRGGQHHNGPIIECRLTSTELDFSITIGYHRSYSSNRRVCELLFDLFLSDL